MENNLPVWRYFLRGCVRVTKCCAIAALVFLALNFIGYWVERLDWIFWADPSSFRQFDSYWWRVSSLAVIGMSHTILCAAIALGVGLVLFAGYWGLVYAGGYQHPRTTDEKTS